MELTRERVQAIKRATFKRRVYLNGLDGNMYWSDYPEKDERDDLDGGPFYATPGAALRSIMDSIGYLVDPETGKKMMVCKRS